MRTPAGWLEMKAAAAALAASNRLRPTSVADMLVDTSSARMMVRSLSGVSSAVTGRAIANTPAARQSRSSPAGTCRRRPVAGESAAMTSCRLA
ncbi:MAG: hypothetical protein LXA50_04075 [Betaproteobacteria bacterium]|jgi:hypothetical protein|nr:hypothetical protein [Betaproteobacteria bacterium]